MILRILAFLLVFGLLQAGFEASRGTAFERWVVHTATVGTAGALIDALDPSIGVEAHGTRLVARGGGLNVLAGCEGIDVIMLLASAMLVAPIALRARLLGLVLGTGLVFALNQLRIVALFHANRIDRDVFAMLHGVVTPLVMVVAVALFYVFWMSRSGAARATAAAG